MAKYTIDWMETKETSTGKKLHKANLTDENGNKLDSVTLWASEWPDVMNGHVVEGTYEEKQNGQYLNKTLYAPKTPKTAQGGAYRAKVVEEAQIRKEGSINRTLDRKEESIKMSSAQRDAVLIVTTFYKDRWINDPIIGGASDMELDTMIKEKVLKYRDWFISHEFEEHTPF